MPGYWSYRIEKNDDIHSRLIGLCLVVSTASDLQMAVDILERR